MTRDDDIRDVMRSERSRGRKPIDVDELKKRQRDKADIRYLLSLGNRKTFIEVLTNECGLQEGSDEYQMALQAWSEYQKRKSQT